MESFQQQENFRQNQSQFQSNLTKEAKARQQKEQHRQEREFALSNDDKLGGYKHAIGEEQRHDRNIRDAPLRSITQNGKIYRHRQEQHQLNRQSNSSKRQRTANSMNSLSEKLESQNRMIQFPQNQGREIFTQDNNEKETQSSSQQYFDQSEDQEEKMMRQTDQEDDFDIQKFILDNNIGECPRYKLPKKNIQIYDRFNNKNTYENFMKELVKYQIIADVNRRMEQKQEEKYQRQIKVKLSQHYIFNKKIDQYEKKVILNPVNDHNKYYVEETLIKGKRLGIITRSLPFTIEKLISKFESTHLCFIWKDRYYENRILVRGLDDLDIPQQTYEYSNKFDNKEEEEQPLKANHYYFMDLDSIISSLRQYRAVASSSELPLIEAICANATVKNNAKFLKEREKTVKSDISNEIKQTRNRSQASAIKDIFLKDAGIYLIQGPPGTGKTESISNFASLEQYYFSQSKQRLQEQQNDAGNKRKKLMICAQSNAAVNHIGRKILREGLIGRTSLPNILRLGHTEEFDEQLLSINLPHLCQISLRGTHQNKDDWSAKLRWQKLLLQEKINKMMSQEKNHEDIKILRKILFSKIRRLVQINDQLQAKKKQYDRIEQGYLQKSEIVLSTLNTSGKGKFAAFFKDKIRCLIIDEASQATQPSTLIPFGTQVAKVLLVGDHMQLQPTVMSNNCRFTRYNRSLFERLIALNTVPYLLDTQYRMVPILQYFPSHQFYGGRLKSGKIIQVPFSLQKLSSSSMFFNVSYGAQEKLKKSYHNQAQAYCVSILIGRLLLYDSKLKIGIIAPYKSQIKYIQYEIFKVPMSQQQRDNIRISTVDAFQGQQVDVVIISCVRANADKMIGFVKDEKRMNVAITRAKYALFVFGNVETLRHNQTWQRYIDHHRRKNSLYELPKEEQCDPQIRKMIELQKGQQNT